MEQLTVTGRELCEVSGTYFKGTEASLSQVQCFLYLVSCSLNISIFHDWLPSGQTPYDLKMHVTKIAHLFKWVHT